MMINQKKYSSRNAFSMLELVFVIVILGIIASISSSVIVQVFQSYIPQKAAATAAGKTEIAAVQIANRLAQAVPWSIVAKNPANPFADFRLLGDIALVDTGETYTALEWIGVDGDGFNTGAWNGFCNTATATRTNCLSNGSTFHTTANTIISNLSNGDVGLNGAVQQPVVIFKTNANLFTTTPPVAYSPACMGMTSPANTSCAIQATSVDATNMTMSAGVKNISEHYVLAWSAYAIVPENCADRNSDGISECDLAFYSNYQPWENEQYNVAGTRTVLLNNVTVFKFSQYDTTIRFKICVQQSIGNNANTPPVTLCKEKVVIR